MSAPHTTLATLAQEFANWRALKRNRFDPMPPALVEAALELRADYSVSYLIKHLKLSPGFF